jgi:hypothetical protein
MKTTTKSKGLCAIASLALLLLIGSGCFGATQTDTVARRYSFA